MKKLLIVSAFLLAANNLSAGYQYPRVIKNTSKTNQPLSKTNILFDRNVRNARRNGRNSRLHSTSRFKSSGGRLNKIIPVRHSKSQALSAQRLCNVMNNPKNFKSMGKASCTNCSCTNGVMTCKCMRVKRGPVARMERVVMKIDFKKDGNQPVIVVPSLGTLNLRLGNLKDFLMNKMWMKYQAKVNPKPKSYSLVK